MGSLIRLLGIVGIVATLAACAGTDKGAEPATSAPLPLTQALPDLIKDPDGGYTLYLQNWSSGPDREANWLPTPAGPFAAVMRLYWPKPDALNGDWKAPAPVKV